MTGVPRVAVVDHGAGNLVSISQGLTRAGARVAVVSDAASVGAADGVVLPGVGSTGSVMEGIEAAGLTETLAQVEAPLLGICVGMQVLFDRSEEDGTRCLGLIAGEVRQLRHAPTLPHIGWNDLEVRPQAPLLGGLGEPVVYFVHSYAPVPANGSVITATARHGQEFVAAVAVGNVLGVQFHPERSGPTGLRILAGFVESCRVGADAA